MAVLKVKSGRKRPHLGPYSRPHNLTDVDGRCKAARMIREFSRELEAHIGGAPTVAQRILIREAAIKNCKLGLLVDRILAADEPDFDLATRCYLAWSGSLRRDLTALGLQHPEVQLPSPIEYLADAKRSRSRSRAA